MLVWLVGIFFAAAAGAVLPSDAEYFWFGLVGGVLGLLLLPIVASVRVGPVLGVLGATVALGLSTTGTLLMLGAEGALGRRAPGWIAPAADAAFLAVLAWIAASSLYGWRAARFGSAVLLAGVLNGAAVGIGVVMWRLDYRHTNATAGLDAIQGLAILASVPTWLIVVALHLNAKDEESSPHACSGSAGPRPADSELQT